jgi:LPXTG-motif cell wall-anchored protein
MRAKDLKLWIVGAMLGATALLGGTAAASDYPPDDTTATTVPQGGEDPPTTSTDGDLPATGSDSNATLKIAGGAIVAGAGMFVASRLRRRPSAG